MVLPKSMQCCAVAAFLFLAIAPTAFADEALTARNKAVVTDFYTTVLIGRNADAARRQ